MSQTKAARKKKAPPKISDLDAERKKRALLKQQHCDAVALHIVGKLIDGAVAEDVFLQTLKYIDQTHFQDIVEERAITNLCGYPVCFNQIPPLSNQTYHISTKSNKVYDVTDRKHFCSNFCYTASNHIKNQILTSPLWYRDQEEIPEFKLLKKAERLAPGEEIDQGIIKIEKSTVEKAPEFLSTSHFTQNILNEIPDDINNAHNDSSSENEEEEIQNFISKSKNPKKVIPQKNNELHIPSTSKNKVEIIEKREPQHDLGSANHETISDIQKDFESLSLNDQKLPELPETNENFFYSKLFSPNLADILNENQKYFENLDSKLNENTKNVDKTAPKGILSKNKGKSIKKSVKFHHETKNEALKDVKVFKKPNPPKKIQNISQIDENSLLSKPVIEHKTIFSNLESSESENSDLKVVQNDNFRHPQNSSCEPSAQKSPTNQNLGPQESSPRVITSGNPYLGSKIVKNEMPDPKLAISNDLNSEKSHQNLEKCSQNIKTSSSQSLEGPSSQNFESNVVQIDNLSQKVFNLDLSGDLKGQNLDSNDTKVEKIQKFEGHYKSDDFLDENAFWEGKNESGDPKNGNKKPQISAKEQKTFLNILGDEIPKEKEDPKPRECQMDTNLKNGSQKSQIYAKEKVSANILEVNSPKKIQAPGSSDSKTDSSIKKGEQKPQISPNEEKLEPNTLEKVNPNESGTTKVDLEGKTALNSKNGSQNTHSCTKETLDSNIFEDINPKDSEVPKSGSQNNQGVQQNQKSGPQKSNNIPIPNPNNSILENPNKSDVPKSKLKCKPNLKSQNPNLEHEKNFLKSQKIQRVENLLSDVKIPKKTESQASPTEVKPLVKLLKPQNFDPLQEIQKIGVQKDLIKNTSYSQAKILSQKFHGGPKNDQGLEKIIKKISQKNNKVPLVKEQLNNKTSVKNMDKNTKQPLPVEAKKKLNKVGEIQDLKLKISDNFLENFERSLYQWFTIDTMVFCYGEDKVRNVLSDKKFKEYLNDKKNLEEKWTKSKKYEEICKKINLMEITDRYYDESVNENANNKKPLPNFEDLKSEAEKMDLRVQAFYSGYFEAIKTEFDYSSCDEKEDDDDNPAIDKGVPAVLPLVESKDYLPLRKKIFLSSLNRTVTKMCEILDQSPNVVQTYLKELVDTFSFDSKNIVFKSAEWPIVTIFLLKLLSIKNQEYSKILKTKSAQKYIEETTKPVFKNDFEKFFLRIGSMENYLKMFLQKNENL